MQERDPAYYSPLKTLAIKRDCACMESYREILGLALPDREYVVLHHVDHRAGCPSRDCEDNVISLSWWDHENRIHGKEEAEYKKKIKIYLGCEEVMKWRKQHAEEILAVEEKKEKSRIRAVRKHCAVKSVRRIR